jgi:diketogulonate reductase-like aldo/keto reductase
MREHGVLLMAYCPLAQGGDLKRGLYQNPVLKQIADNHNATISQILLAFTMRDGNTISIPRTGKKEHTLENAGADHITLTKEELEMIDKVYPAPKHKVFLDIQ